MGVNELISELRLNIKPELAYRVGTTSYERRISADELERQRDKIKFLEEQNRMLKIVIQVLEAKEGE